MVWRRATVPPPSADGGFAVQIRAIKRTIINGQVVEPGSILDVDDIVGTKLVFRNYVEEVWELEAEEAEDIDHEPAADK